MITRGLRTPHAGWPIVLLLMMVIGSSFAAFSDSTAPVQASASGPVMVKDIYPGEAWSFPQHLTNVDGILYFTAFNSYGTELWRSDGTPGETYMVADIMPGAASSEPEELFNLNGVLFFTAETGDERFPVRNLWKSDGTATGTRLVKQSNWPSAPSNLTSLNGTLYFKTESSIGEEFWQSDGTFEGTVPVTDRSYELGIFSGPIAVGDALYFGASGSIDRARSDGVELWRSNGTQDGTILVKDINPGSAGSNPDGFFDANGTLYFMADDGVHGDELWMSDESGTKLVKDMTPGSGGSELTYFTEMNGILYFVASDTDSSGQGELWRSNGSTSGTTMVMDICPGTVESKPRDLTVVSGTLFFVTTGCTFETHGYRQLWKTDGTAANTQLVKVISTSSLPEWRGWLTDVNGTLFFGTEPLSGVSQDPALWQSDGTAEGTLLVKKYSRYPNDGSPTSLFNMNGILYFSAADDVNGRELWKYQPMLESQTEPVIFVPGISGSTLAEGSNELWVDPFGADSEKRRLSLYPSDRPSNAIVATDVLRYIEQLPDIRALRDVRTQYGPMLETMVKEWKYQEYDVNKTPSRRTTDGCDYDAQITKEPNLFVFAYDWRQSNAVTAAQLKDYLGCVREFYPNKKVTIVAHSMGGLVARRYILDNPTTHNVKKLITIGSPWLGAPKAPYILESGDFIPVAASGPDITYIINSFTGVHELLPTRAYFELGGPSPYGENGLDVDGDGNTNELYSYDNFIQAMDKRYGGDVFEPGTANATFHTQPQDNWSADTTGVQYYHIYGTGLSTIERVRMQKQVVFVSKDGDLKRGAELAVASLSWTDGDGTVPVLSARRVGNGHNYNAPSAQLVQVAGDDHLVNHTGLMSNPAVLTCIKHWLVSDEHPSCDDGVNVTRRTFLMSLLGAKDMVVTDSQGNSTNYTVGTQSIRVSIPGVNIYSTGNLSEAATLNATKTYTITFKSQGESFAVELFNSVTNDGDLAVRYEDTTIPLGITARLVVQADKVTPGLDELNDTGVELRYDRDGDGAFESVIPPTAIVHGAQANDREGPAITATRTGQEVLIAATDDSGVKAIYYSLDGDSFQQYTSPLNIFNNQSRILYLVADDKVGNRSSIQELQLTQQTRPVYLPFIGR